MGIVFCATYKKYPLRAIEITDNAIHVILKFDPCASLKPSGHPISNIPAIISTTAMQIIIINNVYRHAAVCGE